MTKITLRNVPTEVIDHAKLQAQLTMSSMEKELVRLLQVGMKSDRAVFDKLRARLNK